MNERELLQKVASVFERLSIRYIVTGGMASIMYGEPRFTSDIDVVAEIPREAIPALIAEFPFPEFFLAEHAVRDAVEQYFQFNILHPSSGLKIDVILAKPNEYDQLRLARAITFQVTPQVFASFASPEDVIVKKLMFYQEGGSEKHLRDIASMLLIREKQLDHEYLAKWIDKMTVTKEWNLVRQRIDNLPQDQSSDPGN